MLMVIFTGCTAKLTKEQSSQLLKVYKEKNFFKLDNLMLKIEFNKKNPDLILYRATLDNVFNKPIESIQLINILLNKYPKYYNDSTIRDLYSMRAENALRLQDYFSAYKDDSLIITKYNHVCDSSGIESLKDDISLFRNLSGVPKMEIEKLSDSKISLKRDKAGLYYVPVIINKDTIDFVFDTGANFSVINKTLATKYGVKILGGKVKIGSSTGIKVEAETGLLDIILGSIKIKNVVFVIFPDSALSFSNDAYIIKGIVGFPIMYGLQEFIIRDDKFLVIPQNPEESNSRNFAFDALTPVIMVEYQNDTLSFHFDTGATSTSLYSLFFNKYKTEIIKHCKKINQSFGGAGGYVKSEVYLLDSAIISAGNSQCKLDSLEIIAKDFNGNDVKYFYGSFGQDYIKQFSEMKINFASMNINFTGKKK